MATKSNKTLVGYRNVVFVLFLMVLSVLIYFGVSYKNKGYRVRQVMASGELELTDGEKIGLSGIIVKPSGHEKHQAALFVLSEMTKNSELWVEDVGDGYKVWIGCKNRWIYRDCSEAVLVNEELLELDLADRI